MADDIIRTMEAAGFTVRETDPFDTAAGGLVMTRKESPYVNRVRLTWDAMRGPVLAPCPRRLGVPAVRQAT